MTRVLAWTRKEAGDHRAILIAIAIAVPLLTGIAFWAFGKAVSAAQPEGVGLIFSIGIMVLLWFGIASDLIAVDARRGTMSVARRAPGGLRSALCGKLLFLILAVATLSGWTALCVNVAWWICADSAARYATPGGSHAFWSTILMVAPLLSWPVLVGTWMGRSGAAGIGALLLLGVVGAIAFLVWRANPNVFPGRPLALLPSLTLAVGLVGLVVAAWSFLLGHRYRGRAWRPFLVGAPALMVLLGSGVSYGAWKVHRWNHIEVGATDVSIYSAQVASDGTFWMTVYRGTPWFEGSSLLTGRGSKGPGTPLQTWVVDPKTKQARSLGSTHESIVHSPDGVSGSHGGYTPLDPATVLLTHEPTGDESQTVGWWDVASRERVALLPSGIGNGTTDRMMRRWLKSTTPHRDAQGAKIWVRNGLFEREGDPFVPGAVAYNRIPKMAVVPDGWMRVEPVHERVSSRVLRRNGAKITTIDLDGVASTTHTQQWMPGRFALSRTHYVRSAKAGNDYHLRVFAYADETHDGTRGLRSPESAYAAPVAQDLVLARRGESDEATIVLWNPRTGEDQSLQWTGDAPRGVERIYPVGRRSDGAILVYLSFIYPTNAKGRRIYTFRYAVLSVEARTLTLVTDEFSNLRLQVLAMRADHSVVVMEGAHGGFARRYQRIVQYGPKPGERQVLWPFDK